MIRLFALLCLCWYSLTCFAQYPAYAPPLKGPLLVTGTFGELRTDHFHAGLDFRASTGTAVYSIGDGYVSRIKISPGSYGQAIYIDHPEGYRSVYGHLSALAPELIDTVRAAQMKREQFGVDLHFDAFDFPVNQGQKIGAVGNRGYSFGPHLHFEIRSQENDAALNPLHFGIKVKDSRSPQLRKLKVYERDVLGRVVAEQILSLRSRGNGKYDLLDTLVVGSDYVDFALKAYDRQDAMPNYNGPYGMELVRDSNLIYAFRFDSIPFEESLRLNAHVDYAEWTGKESWFHRLHDLPNGQIGYLQQINFSTPKLVADETTTVEIKVMDWSGNTSTLAINVLYQPDGTEWQPPTTAFYRIPWKLPSMIELEDISLAIPAEAFYEDLEMELSTSADSSSGILSQVVHIHDLLTPIQKNLQLTIRPNQPISSANYDKVILTRCTSEGATISYGNALNEDGQPISLPVRSFGTYCLQQDNIPPSIEAVGFSNPLGRNRRISFRITDNVETAGLAKGLQYQATLDGEWMLFEYDLKKDLIYHEVRNPINAAGSLFRLEVVDDCGNRAVFERLLKP